MSIQSRQLEYADGDVVLEGLLAWDDAVEGPRPGVMVSHAWAGRTGFEDSIVVKLAELGYVGFALDLYGKGARGSTNEENVALMQPFLDDRETLQSRLLLSLNTMREQTEVDAENVAAIGYCFGGLSVLDIARTGEDLAGVASFHGSLVPPGNTEGNTISAKVLVMHGWDDPMVPPEHFVALAEELTSMGADWQMHGYGNTLHAFAKPGTNDPAIGALYSETADRRSWVATQNFLAELFA